MERKKGRLQISNETLIMNRLSDWNIYTKTIKFNR
jgi:hypothetical protein